MLRLESKLAHFEVRRVSYNAGIRWHSERVNVSHTLGGEYIGLEEVDYGIWDVYFAYKWLGRLIESENKIIDDKGRLQRRKTHGNV